VKPDRTFFERIGMAEPTQEQWDAAEQRYRDENRAHNEALAKEGKVDCSDYQCGLEFVMATYTPAAWKTLFYPEEQGKEWMG